MVARYGGGSKFFRGKITRDHGDGTYDITYDEGDCEQETRVAAELIDGGGAGGGGYIRGSFEDGIVTEVERAGYVRAVSFSADGRYLAVGGRDKKAAVIGLGPFRNSRFASSVCPLNVSLQVVVPVVC